MSLIEQWANKYGITEPLNGSWIEAIAIIKFNLDSHHANDANTLFSIAKKIGVSSNTSDLYHDIAIQLSNNSGVEPLNGSWLERIVELA